MATRWFRHTFVDGICADCGQALYHDVQMRFWPKSGATCYSKANYDGQVYYQQRQPRDWKPCSRKNAAYVCLVCNGSGVDAGAEVCTECKGSGKALYPNELLVNSMVIGS